MQEQHIQNIPLIQGLRDAPIISDALIGGGEIAVFQGGEGRLIGFGSAAGVRLVPKIISKAHGYRSNLVVTPAKKITKSRSFLRGVPFRQKWVAEPAPVFVLRPLHQHRFIANNVLLEVSQ